MHQDLTWQRESSTKAKFSMQTILSAASRLDRVAMGMLRAALVLVLVWIGGLKFVNYEADSIVPLVANSPLMSFLYHQPSEYRTHMNKEGELNLQHRAWHEQNGTYLVLSRFGDRHCVDRRSDCVLPISTGTVRTWQLPLNPDVLHDTLVPGHYA